MSLEVSSEIGPIGMNTSKKASRPVRLVQLFVQLLDVIEDVIECYQKSLESPILSPQEGEHLPIVSRAMAPTTFSRVCT